MCDYPDNLVTFAHKFSQDCMMNTPLILATLSGHGGIVRLLLKANCDVNKTGKSVGKAVKPIQIAVTKETLAIR